MDYMTLNGLHADTESCPQIRPQSARAKFAVEKCILPTKSLARIDVKTQLPHEFKLLITTEDRRMGDLREH
jgi:hypothetical protein